MLVLKFGGTSVGTPERMHKVANLIQRDMTPKIVVLSAVSGTTNALVELVELLQQGKSVETNVDNLKKHYAPFINELYNSDVFKERGHYIVDNSLALIEKHVGNSFSELSEKEILAQGEIISTRLFQAYLEEIDCKSTLLNSLEFMFVDKNKEPEIKKISEHLLPIIESNSSTTIFITQGFICSNNNSEIDNLERGGSDYSASIIGAAINADEVQIWTDIDGMHNNDPRHIKATFPIEELSFDEAAELAYFGAKILHPASILPAKKYNIPVRLKSTLDENASGTLITQRLVDIGIKAIAAKDGITAIKIKSARMLLAHGFLRKIFEIFEKHTTSIDMITTSEVAVSLTIDNDQNLMGITKELEKLGIVEIDRNQTIICVVGNMVAEKTGVIHHVFDALAGIPIRMVSYGGSRHNISILVNSEHKIQALRDLNQGLFQSKIDLATS